MRLDVATDFIEPWVVPLPEWPASDTEESLKAEDPTVALLKELLAGR
jgi:hypothetical protein